jgi:uncharacterized protein YyaL (SSP411 family)
MERESFENLEIAEFLNHHFVSIYLPGAVVAVAENAGAGGSPIFEGRPMVGGRPTAYCCRGRTCWAPVTEPAELKALLSGNMD